MGPNDRFWANLAKTACKAIILEPYFHLSQARPHFNLNFIMNSNNLLEVKSSFHLEIRALKIRIGSIWPKAFGKKIWSRKSKILVLIFTNAIFTWPESTNLMTFYVINLKIWSILSFYKRIWSSFSTTFYVWFFMKNICLFIFYYATQKMKFSIKDLFSKCDRISRKPRIWSHLLRKSLMKNFHSLCNFNWPNFIVWLHLLLEILNNMCIVIICGSDYDVRNFEINLSCFIKPFFFITKK